MKTVILSMLLLFAAASASAAIEGTVTDVYCGEMDPFVVGDACVVFSTDDETGARLGLVFRDYDWYEKFVNEPDSGTDVIGDSFTAQCCKKMDYPEAISVLKDINSEYSYLSCYVDGFSWK